MARINTTKIEIIRVATKMFLEKGFSATSAKAICHELDISTGNLTFYFPTKDYILAELVDKLCSFQWKVMEEEAQDGLSSIMALCLEFATMVAMCEDEEIAKDFYISAYSSPMCLDIIRKNDTARAKEVFKDYCSEWTDEQFAEAEILVSGIEHATLITAGDPVSIETRISGAINTILSTYNVPEEIRKLKIQKVLAMDYRKIGGRLLRDFKKFANKENEQALINLFKG